jgi:hypothetical protein
MSSTLFVDAIEPNLSSGVHIPGHVIQVVNFATNGASASFNNTSWNDTLLTITITPKSSTSIIIVDCSSAVGIDQGANDMRVDIRLIETLTSAEIFGHRYVGNDGTSNNLLRLPYQLSGKYPCSSTNPLTFKVQIRKAAGIDNQAGVIYANWYAGSTLTIRAMEIAQ